MELGPLSGWSVAVTADRRAGEQAELLARKGAHVLAGPVIRTHPLGVEAELASAIWAVIDEPPAYTLLTTGIGVRGLVEAAEALDCADQLLDALRSSVVLARGPKAHGAAVTVGLEVAWHTPNGTAKEMVDELDRRGVGDRRVAVQLDGATASPLAAAVARLGAGVTGLPVYRWTMPTDLGPARRLLDAVCERRVDAVTFTARPQIENLCELAALGDRLDDLLRALRGPVTVACVGPVCAQGAVDAGFGSPVVPRRPRLGSMVLALAEEFSTRSVLLDVPRGRLRIQGRLVQVDGEVIQLTERERDLLAVLTERPGAVRSKAELLEHVWDDGADEHTVEVTVGRLRQRLGDHGVVLETVLRRGYRLAVA